MITVPDEVKDLFHLDHCYKNIRIHFPNGERSDICNDLIVKDSVAFKESLCSQNTLKFGLSESPVFECETVGVGNIKGATIEVSCEIECPSDVTGAEWKIDLQKYVYPILYGTFVVSEAKRQADMIHRKIVAYKEIAIRKWNVVSVEKAKQIRESLYTPNLGYFLAANGIGIIELYSAEEAYTNWTRNWYMGGTAGTSIYGETVRIDLYGIAMSFYESIPARDYDALYRAETKSLLTLEQLQNSVAAFFLENDRAASLYKSFKNDFDKIVAKAFRKIARQYIGTNPATVSQFGENDYLYPYLNNFYSIQNAKYEYLFPTHVEVEYQVSGSGGYVTRTDTFYVADASEFKAYKRKITASNVVTDLRLNIPTNYPQSNAVDFSKYSDIQALVNSYAELLGIFSSYDREGEAKGINIKRQFGMSPTEELYPGSALYPQGVTGGKLLPDDYQSCWYDDGYTMPFGAVRCQYKNTNNEDIIYTLYLTGYDESVDENTYKIYDLSDNEIIKSFLWTNQQIASVCNIIASNIDGVSYMPVEFVGRGLPYVEAGDTFEILTKSNDSITTIVLNRTIKGEQTLTDEYKSV